MIARIFFRLGREAVIGGQPVDVAVLLEDDALVGGAQPGRRRDQRIEHGLQVEGRAADDLEHVGGGGLLLQRFGQVFGALLHLVE